MWPWPPHRGQFNTAAFSFASPTTGWVLAYGGELRTRDGGRDWTEFKQPNASDGWIVAYGGHLLRTADGGRTWAEVAGGSRGSPS